MATNKLSLKLLIDKKANRVLFTEAGKDFVDFLFSLLSLPVGSVIKLLGKSKMVGCIGNLYQSVETLDETYILQPKKNKDLLLMPKPAAAASLNVPLLTMEESSEDVKRYYGCHGHSYVTNDSRNICPGCNGSMTRQYTYVSSKTEPATSGNTKGYVKEVVTYTVMDDLTVMPMSTISSMTLLNKFNVENVALLEERVVDLGMEKGLELLKTSLQSKSVGKTFYEQ